MLPLSFHLLFVGEQDEVGYDLHGSLGEVRLRQQVKCTWPGPREMLSDADTLSPPPGSNQAACFSYMRASLIIMALVGRTVPRSYLLRVTMLTPAC